jgi:hypothetical protein
MRILRPLLVGSTCLILFGSGTLGAVAANVAVDVELVIAGDVSHSMDDRELRLQREGFTAAFRHPEIQWAIRSGATGRIAVTYVEWAGPSEQWIVVPWTILADRQGADAFADRLATAPIVKGAHTSMSYGLRFAALQFNASRTEAYRRTIDISGDGPNNVGPPIDAVRDSIVRTGITINGLSFAMSSDGGQGPFSYLFQFDDFDLETYFEDCVIGGAGAFAMTANDPSRFIAAIRRKLVWEIASRPARVVQAAFVSRSASRTDCSYGDGKAPE